MKDRIKLLPHWCLSDNDPAFYDTESKTAIGETALVYANMQKLIDDYNKFVDEVNISIQKFESDTTITYEQFKVQITKLVHDYIITIDSKIAHQNRYIEETLEQMKTTLKEYAEELNAEVYERLSTNETNISNLDERVTTLENSQSVDVGDLENRVTTNEENISKINNDYINPIFNEIQVTEMDLNNLTDTSTYEIANTVTNIPNNKNGVVYVKKGLHIVNQTYITIDNEIFTRTYNINNQSWSEWVKSGTGTGETSELEDTGYTEVVFSASSKFSQDSYNPLKYRKVGKVVQLVGRFHTNQEITDTTSDLWVFTIPSEYYPHVNSVYEVCQGTGKNTWYARMSGSGNFHFGRYGSSEIGSCPANADLDINMMYLSK